MKLAELDVKPDGLAKIKNIQATPKSMKVNDVLEELEQLSGPYFNIPRETGCFLYMLVKVKKAKNILEVGTSNGYSTIWLAWAAKEKNGKVTTIERDRKKIDEARENFKKAGLDNITILEGDATEVTKTLAADGERFDFVFLDATKKEYLTYLKNVIGCLEHGAVITADNVIVFREKMQDFLDFLKQDNRFNTMSLQLGTGLEFSIYVKD